MARQVESAVARHYTAVGLLERIVAGLTEAGIDPARARPEDLSPVDEFHIGGAEATEALVGRLGIAPKAEVLDIGCGIGGAARHVARRTGAQVTGVDLTEAFVAVAAALSEMVGMAGATRFEVASALALPFEDARFDAALMLHVGMNIPDKRGLFAEARRVLRPGAAFGVYEVMQTGAGALDFPVPWASDPATSFVAGPDDYREAARAAGFALESERALGAYALDFFARMRAAMEAQGGPPPLGIHLLMEDHARKIANMVANIEAGRIAPVEMIFRAGS